MKTSANGFSYIASKVRNIPLKLRREINRIPPFQTLRNQAYQKALDSHFQFLPQLDSQGQSILAMLRQQGTCVIPIEDLELSSTTKMMNTASALAENLKFHSLEHYPNNDCEVGSSGEDLNEFPEILLWALESKLLDIVENYIGLPIMYQSFAMRKSVADGQYSGVRCWHMDWEDRRIIKVIIYLNDVIADGGPYQYISRTITDEAVKKLNYYNLGYVSDEKMAKAIPKSNWNTCLGKKGTVVISDPSAVFHRAQPPTQDERFSITFCYTSATPHVIWRSRKMSPQQWEFINKSINQRQKDCLPKKDYPRFV